MLVLRLLGPVLLRRALLGPVLLRWWLVSVAGRRLVRLVPVTRWRLVRLRTPLWWLCHLRPP
ncbi:hypothetical protein GCM10011609_41410 [Lentzea pudingi]|uniref:Secreted protein n=1 Tax=Lentzea pudingi TaxID=1789439 RepID=A0ABQ2I6G8_9PSEU|nr:hypothetical protein GCM10011609_41410 [Lentzea pudingi]